MKINRFSKYQFKSGLVAKNRIVVPPMASQTADENGFVTDQTIEHYANLARSGAGLIIAEYSFVHRSGKGEEKQMGADTDAQLTIKEISERVGVPPSTYREWENDRKISAERLLALADALEISPAEPLGDESINRNYLLMATRILEEALQILRKV